MFNISSLLSARLFMAPKLVDGRIYFVSNISGRLSLYAMDYGGSVPEPLLPPDLALQNPELIGGEAYYVFPKLGKIVVMLDHDGDENYQPVEIPLNGGFPEPCFKDAFAGTRVHMGAVDVKTNTAYFMVESRTAPVMTTYLADFAAGKLVKVYESPYGAFPAGHTAANDRATLTEGYTTGDIVLYLWKRSSGKHTLLYGVPLDDRKPGQEVPLNGINAALFVDGERGLLMSCSVFDDAFAPAYMDLAVPGKLTPVPVKGIRHHGKGELYNMIPLGGERVLLDYNIDGCSWLYEGEYDPAQKALLLKNVVCGRGELANGKLESYYYDSDSDRYIVSFSTATTPTQIYTIEGKTRRKVVQHTQERVLGVGDGLLSPGEDASFTSFDGLRVSARLYLPAASLGYKGRRPLVYYIHGGPQGQERPDFAWFSMPLIQFLTLNGFAVFVPNVRGSTGYGLSYTKQVDRDWGGKDRQDHAFAMQHLSSDKRVDTARAAVVGRSYGGYMTLTMAGRHPELWKAAVDMFGPYNLLTFSERIPATWKPYFEVALGHPVKDHDFLVERSPQTYIDQITCPLLVIQGKNDPRVAEPESRDLVEHLRSNGRQVEYMMFENEGHDVLKHENRIRCYNGITEFFIKYLKP